MRNYIKTKLMIPEELFYSLVLIIVGMINLVGSNDLFIGVTLRQIIGILLCLIAVMLPYHKMLKNIEKK